jgi:trehalose 6-phosphate synthase
MTESEPETGPQQAHGQYRFVVAASRLPVDRVTGPDGETEWRTSPGGLVAALEPT